jgi:hypothetical protein
MPAPLRSPRSTTHPLPAAASQALSWGLSAARRRHRTAPPTCTGGWLAIAGGSQRRRVLSVNREHPIARARTPSWPQPLATQAAAQRGPALSACLGRASMCNHHQAPRFNCKLGAAPAAAATAAPAAARATQADSGALRCQPAAALTPARCCWSLPQNSHHTQQAVTWWVVGWEQPGRRWRALVPQTPACPLQRQPHRKRASRRACSAREFRVVAHAGTWCPQPCWELRLGCSPAAQRSLRPRAAGPGGCRPDRHSPTSPPGTLSEPITAPAIAPDTAPATEPAVTEPAGLVLRGAGGGGSAQANGERGGVQHPQ